MRKLLFILSMILISASGITFGQSFDWNLRGGANIMNSQNEDKDVAAHYHLGVQAGIRVASFGFYGEALYSMLENQYGGDPVAYFAPSLIVKTYMKKYLFIEIGGTLLSKSGDSGIPDDTKNPDGKVLMAAGLGACISKAELSFRTTFQQSYSILQVTAAVKF